MYMATSEPISISTARAQLSELVAQVTETGEPVFLARHGRRTAAIIDADVLDQLVELAEEMQDVRATEAARAELAERAATPIPWDEVKADLGLA